ncbi:SAP domain-containing ribonucleoprotein [Drosophila takahashii]|uniref:SAP domain-containing ribonucleoprotein n=1 Tax=Drosophila takahashii TaxID=29030 RepID=UPI001CF823A8|nr:PHD finger protein rhinoceros [Drosophila takahashii]
MPESDVTKMKVADLKRELKLRGLTVNGNKTELQDRLATALLEGDISLEDSAIADAIDDDDVSLTDEDEHKLLGDENDDELLKSPVSTPTTVAIPELLAEAAAGAVPAGPAKKIVLKRNNSQQSTGTAASTGTTPSKENEAPTTTAGEATEETPTKKHKPIVVGPKTEGEKASGDKKLTQLTAQERLELRAKKFGITPVASPAVSTAASTVAAAINKSSSASITANKGNKETEEQQKEALKRRAERFGCVVPEKATKAGGDDRLQKRKERFGAEAAAAAATEATSTGATTESKDKWSEKARARLERFKTAPAAEASK